MPDLIRIYYIYVYILYLFWYVEGWYYICMCEFDSCIEVCNSVKQLDIEFERYNATQQSKAAQ